MRDGFVADLAIFSNYYIVYSGIKVIIEHKQYTALTAEHIFQASKATNFQDRADILMQTSPAKARRLGHSILIRKDWEEVKLGFMELILKEKFNIWYLTEQLIKAQDSQLVEYNRWHDNYWGVCVCGKCNESRGQNNLGKLLIKIRHHKLEVMEIRNA